MDEGRKIYKMIIEKLSLNIKLNSTINFIALSFLVLFSFGCKNQLNVLLGKPKVAGLNVTVSNVQVINHQLVITGTNLDSVSEFQIKEDNTTSSLQIESKSNTTLVANTLSNITFGAGKVLDFIFSNANAAATFQVNFSLCQSTLGGAGFSCTTPNDKEVLSFDASTNKWKPRSMSGLSYKGAWDANDLEPTGAQAGDYFIVSVANLPTYDVGDWIVFNGTSFDLIDNSQAIVSVAGKTGAVTLNLSDLTNISLTAPTAGQVLRYNGTNWVNFTQTFVESDPSVSAFAKAALPTCGGGEVLKSDGTSFSCVTAGAGGTFSGTPNRAVVTDGSGALAVSAITDTVLGYLAGTTSNIQSQLDSKQGTLGNGSITSAHIADGTVTNNDLAGSIAQSKITDLTTDLAAKQDAADLGADVRAILLDGLSTATNAVITVTDSILSAFGKLQKQLIDLDSSSLKTTGGTLILGTIDGVPTPISGSQVANKAYVDNAVSTLGVTCPTGYVLVPANSAYFPKQFCVAKYEMKDDGYGVAVSRAAGTPITNVNRAQAREYCQVLGSGYDLISNDQWQNIARNIASVAANWSGNAVGSGELNRGHSDSSPNNALDASADDVNGNCFGTGETCSSTVWDSQRRTHILSNGSIIWDLSGNVSEWTTNSNSAANGADGPLSTMSTGDIRQTRYGAATGTFCATPGSSPYCGMGYGYFNSGSGGVIRSGAFGNGLYSGIFAAVLSLSINTSFADIGLRCVFVP